MVFKRFRIVVITRVFIISITLYLFLYLIFSIETRLYATILIVALLLIYEIYGLIFYVEKTNRDLQRFLLTIKHEDFSQTFLGAGLGTSFDELKKAFNDVIKKFHQTRSEKEEHFRYLQTVVQHVGIGLLAFSVDGKVTLFNNAAKKILKKPVLKNVSDLDKIDAQLAAKLLAMNSGQKDLLKINDGEEILQLIVNSTEFRMRDQNYTLVSLQNIQSELEQQELEAWQKLIRVLTHEIMNSVTPIASLASTLNDLVAEESDEQDFAERQEDLTGGLKTIQRRSQGLLHFVNAYRNLTRVPVPDIKIVEIRELYENVVALMQEEIRTAKIDISFQIQPDNLQLTADPELIEQILINMVKNAIQAFNGKSGAKIELQARIDTRGRLILQVWDNGPGIPEDVQDKIFIPFFTTKEGGSGIGLSLSRQIMRLHRGTIRLQSKSGEGTVFTLRF